MGRKGVISILVILAGLLLSEHGATGQTTSANVPSTATTLVFESTRNVGVVISGNSCPSYKTAGAALCSSVNGISDINAFLASGDLSTVCSHSLLQYGCAQLGDLPSSTITEILKCFLTNENAVTSQESFSLLISQLKIETLGAVINSINNLVPSSNITKYNRKYMLNAVWEKLRENQENLNPGFLATWFQEKLYAFISSVDLEILDCIISLPLSCDGFEAVVGALNIAYDKFNQDNKEEIGLWITRFVKAHSCKKATPKEFLMAYYKSFANNVNSNELYEAWGTKDLGAAIDVLTDFQLAQYVSDSNSFSSYEAALPILHLLATKDFTFNYNFLTTIHGGNYDLEIVYSLLYNTLIKINSTDDPLCRPRLKAIFQGKLSFLFRGLNSTVLDLIAPVDCSDYQDVYQAIDEVYSDLSADVRQILFKYRLNFLNAEALKSGSGCTYGLTSSQWLQLNFGKSVGFLFFADMTRLNPYFNGYDAIELLNVNQTLDLIIESRILTSASPKDFEAHIQSLIAVLKTRDFAYLQGFLFELRIALIRLKIQFINNINVRYQFLQGVWGILEKQFAQFTHDQWYTWSNEYLYILLPSVTTKELSILTNVVVGNCSNLQTIVGGFDSGFEYMNENTKSDVANWITGFLRNHSSKCLVDDWLNVNYKRFKTYVDVVVIKELNTEFVVIDHLDELTADQIGQAVVTEKSALSNVTYMEIVFEVLTNSTQAIENLGAFWDSFNINIEKVEQFTEEVKYKMLEWTVEEISVQFSTFKSEDYSLWFEERLISVTTVIDRTILAEFPADADCDSYKAFVHALSINYEETVETSKRDVFDFMTNTLSKGKKCSEREVSTIIYIEAYFGNYSVETTYELLISFYSAFNPFEEGVLNKLTEIQIGDMMVVANVFESEEYAIKVFDYLRTLTIEKVDICITQFTATAIQKNINIKNYTVGQYILQSYLNIIKTSLTTYNHTEIIQLFKFRISILIKFFTVKTLQLFVIEDCDTLVVIVTQLDNGFSSMSEETKKEIASWILGLLKSKKLNGCTTISQTTSVWVESTLKQFFAFITLAEAKEVYHSLDVMSVIRNTSISQKVEYIIGSEEVLKSVESTKIVLESLSGSDTVVSVSELYTFLNQFNVAYEELNVKFMTSEVRETAMTFLFTSFVSNLNTLTIVEISQFQETFQFFLLGTTEDAVKVIPMTISCDVFKAIFSAFSSVSNELSKEVSKFIFETIIKFLQTQHNGSTDVCGSLYTDSKTYVQNIYFDFLEYATVYELYVYYSKFNVYEVLTKLSGQQLGNLFINSTAIRDQFKAVQILVELEKREYSEVSSFMSECTKVAKERNIETLPDANIESLVYRTVWEKVATHLKSTEDYSYWFGENLQLIISSISTENIEALTVSDCDSQKYVVKSFGKAFDKLDDDQKSSVYGKIKEFNKEQKNTRGSACETESGSSSEWAETFIGSFIKLAKLKEIKEGNANFSAATALHVLSGAQVAEYVIEDGVLRSKEKIVIVLESFDTEEKVKDFYVQLNEAAPEELKTSPHVKVITSKTFEIIEKDLENFKTGEWKLWFQDILKNILFAVTETELERIPQKLSCASYQELLKGFNNAFDDMEEETRKNVYEKCVKRQLSNAPSQNGVRCGQQTQKSQEWLDVNFRKFSIYANVTVFAEWNVNFKITEVIENLNPDQLAEVAVEAIEKEEIACQVAGKVQQFEVDEAYSFLDTFYASFKKTNKVQVSKKEISYKFLSASVSAIKPVFFRYTMSDWENLFSVRFQPFLSSINAEQLTTILASADCDGYAVVVKSLDSQFDAFTADDQQSLFGVLEGFLKKKSSASGACPVSGENSVASASRLLGKFTKFVAFESFPNYILNFDALSAIDLLSPDQKASLAFSGDILDNATKAQVLVSSISAMSFSQLDIFLSSFQAIGEQKKIPTLGNDQIRASLFSAVYGIVSKQFSAFSNEQWSNYWKYKFNLFLRSITQSQIELIPENINCNAFQSVISGLSSHYNVLSVQVQTAIFQKAKSYLTVNKPSSGPACPAISGGSGEWLNLNFGLFSEFGTVIEIRILYPGFSFTDAVAYLTAEQLGYYVANAEVLSDKDKISKVMSGITSETIGEFMDAFNDGLVKAGITQISNVQVKKFFLGEICCKLGSIFSSFTPSNYSNWFGEKLKFFISSIDAKALGFIPLDISCDSLAAIMAPLIQVENPENPNAIYSFVKSVLETQKSSSGVACTGAGLNTREWVMKFIGKTISAATWTEIMFLNPTFQVMEVTDYLTQVQLAAASTSSSIIRNSTAFTSLLLSFSGDLDEFLVYIETLKDFSLKDSSLLSNIKVRDTLLMIIGENVFSNFGDMDSALTKKWLTAVNFLLPGINATMLEQFPLACTCEQYQTFVKALSDVSSSLTSAKKQDIGAFIKRFLLNKYTKEEDACTAGLTTTASYVNGNIGSFCKQLTPEDIKQFNPAIEEVSYTQYCSLS